VFSRLGKLVLREGKASLAEMQTGIAIWRELGLLYLLPPQEAALAEAEAAAGEIDAGLKRLEDALAELESTKQRWYEAEIHRIHGEILLKSNTDDTAAGKKTLQIAIAIAK